MPNTEVQIGGPERERVILPSTNDDGTPKYYKVKVKGFRKKQGKPNDQGQETWFYSWGFEVIGGEHEGVVIYGSTNDEARRSYTTKKPLKLLQLIMAVNGGVEPAKGQTWSLEDLIGKEILVALEEKSGADGEIYQQVSAFYPVKRASVAATAPVKKEMPGEALPDIQLETSDGVDPEDPTNPF